MSFSRLPSIMLFNKTIASSRLLDGHLPTVSAMQFQSSAQHPSYSALHIISCVISMRKLVNFACDFIH